MLETTLATRFLPGSNVKGESVGASWRFLLPRLDLDRVVWLGDPPSEAAARALRQTCGELVVAGGGLAPEVEDGSASLVVTDDGIAHQAEARRVLEPSGLVFVNGRRPAPERARTGGRFWLAPPTGRVTAAAPLDDPAAIRFLERHAREDAGVRRSSRERIRRAIRRNRPAARRRTRIGMIASASGDPPAPGPPAYLQALARSSGVDLSGWRYGIAAPGTYGSKKVLAFLFEADAAQPSIVVKITRDPAFNARLENERRALDELEERGFGTAETVPRVPFGGYHAGLAMVGETALHGVPFRLRSSGRASCRYLREAAGYLVELGQSAAPSARPAGEAASAFGSLVGQFAAIYAPADAHRAFLERQLETIRRSASPFPLVFQHGDPGTWNALATPGGRVAFLDWEAAEPHGVPLWDLFYFFRSYAQAGTRSAREPFLKDPGLIRLLAQTMSAHARRIGLDPALAEPLFYLCLVHRALKEATRLSAERLDRSQFAGMLARCIEGSEDESVRHLFRLEAA